MNEKLKYYLNDIEKNDIGASDILIKDIQQQLDFKLADDYIDLLKEINGGEGEVGENSWLYFFPIQDLIETNNNYLFLMKEIPDYFLFGKDAADTGYAFHKQNQTIHSFGLMSNFKTDPIEFCGNNFLEFLEYLYNQ
jgi:SMI1 / KNR4 family (SUKH-1)